MSAGLPEAPPDQPRISKPQAGTEGAGGYRQIMESVAIGCSGWNYEEWDGRFYPKDVPKTRWLEHYGSVFETVEVNATFYRLQSESTFDKWAKQVPDGFLFAVKASRFLTHVRRLGDSGESLRKFWEPMQPLRDSGKLGPILWQLPENFKRDEERLNSFMANLPMATHCFEFRHASWFSSDVYSLLDENGASLVLAHDPRRDLPVPAPVGPVVYLRLHYGERGRRGNYSGSELTKWRRRIAAWRSERPVYAYLNNDWEGFAPRNAGTLKAGLSGQD